MIVCGVYLNIQQKQKKKNVIYDCNHPSHRQLTGDFRFRLSIDGCDTRSDKRQ